MELGKEKEGKGKYRLMRRGKKRMEIGDARFVGRREGGKRRKMKR